MGGHALVNMEIFRDETEFTDIRMVHRVVDMFEKRPHIQRIVRLGLLGKNHRKFSTHTSLFSVFFICEIVKLDVRFYTFYSGSS